MMLIFFCYCSGFGCIQSQCWPILLQGLDLIGTAQVCGGCSPVQCILVIVHGELYEHGYIWSFFVCFLLFLFKVMVTQDKSIPFIIFLLFLNFFSVLCKLDDICLHLPSCCNSIILYSHEHLNEPQD